MVSNYTIYRTRMSIILILFSFQLFASVTPLDISRDATTEHTFSPLTSTTSETDNTPFPSPQLKLQPFQTPSILFIIADDSSPDSNLDVPFYDFMSTNLSYNVIYHSANNSYD